MEYNKAHFGWGFAPAKTPQRTQLVCVRSFSSLRHVSFSSAEMIIDEWSGTGKWSLKEHKNAQISFGNKHGTDRYRPAGVRLPIAWICTAVSRLVPWPYQRWLFMFFSFRKENSFISVVASPLPLLCMEKYSERREELDCLVHENVTV